MHRLILLTILSGASWAAPAPIHIHRPVPTTETLREELLAPRLDRLLLEDTDNSWSLVSNQDGRFDPETESRLTHYLDGHLLQEFNRIDNPYLHNRPGIGFGFDL